MFTVDTYIKAPNYNKFAQFKRISKKLFQVKIHAQKIM